MLDSVSDMRWLAERFAPVPAADLALQAILRGSLLKRTLLNETGVSDTDAHIQSLAQGVIRLEQSVHDFGIARRRLEIVKLRGVAYAGRYHDLRMQTGGMRVFPRLENCCSKSARCRRKRSRAPSLRSIPWWMTACRWARAR